ncbi:unnamed protein product [Linum tenue]|uniref:Uncharacterized protein n=1 Tax=Linum tenue TaxID=586396 RepID=A0AAV0R4G0_9ROSI|nr:unnamed protein product [Linum tenue]CAI0552106.1 unnamed protein product [Linum tenue]
MPPTTEPSPDHASTSSGDKNSDPLRLLLLLPRFVAIALLSFGEGPPFTLQRLCEIMTAKSIYPNLSKLALALGKNLLVTSTLAACTDPHPLATQKQDETDKASPNQQHRSNSEQNGVQQSTAADGDEIVAEIETDWR